MISIRRTRTVAAGATDTTTLAGDAIENIPFDGKVELWATQAAVGLLMTMSVDQRVSGRDMVPNVDVTGAVNMLEDKLAEDVAEKRSHLALNVQNPTVGPIAFSFLMTAKEI